MNVGLQRPTKANETNTIGSGRPSPIPELRRRNPETVTMGLPEAVGVQEERGPEGMKKARTDSPCTCWDPGSSTTTNPVGRTDKFWGVLAGGVG